MALNKGFVRGANTDAVDARLMDAAKIIRRVDGTPIGGVLSTPQADGGVVSGTQGMSVNIADGSAYALTRGATDGVVFLTNVGVVSVAVAAAPTANSRIDIVYLKQNDSTQGDSDSLPNFGIATGTAAASPVAPSVPTGALQLARLTVQAGATSTAGSNVTIEHNFTFTAMLGGVMRYRSSTAMMSQLPTLPNGTFGQIDNVSGSSGLSVVRNGRWVRVDASTFVVCTGTNTVPSSTTLGTLGGAVGTYFSSDTTVFQTRNDNVIGPLTVAGWYQVSGGAQWTSTGNGNRYIAITRNDDELTPSLAARMTAQGQSPQTVNGMMLLGVGDFIKLKGWQDSNSTLTCNMQLAAELKRAA